MLALVDCNSCFASCETIFRPELRDKPVVVLSNNDGCIVARNAYAKALDIPDLQPYFQLKSYLEKHQVKVFSSNYELYGDVSRRIMTLLETFTRELEVYSIDEAFLNLNGFQDLAHYGHKIKNEVWKQQRMPVCVGIGETKTLSKLANHIAKKSRKLRGVCMLDDLERWQSVFQKIAVNKVWGVGNRIARRLATWDVHTVQDLRMQPLKRIRKEFGVTLERTVNELNGISCFDLETQPAPKKEIVSSRSFGEKVTELSQLKESVSSYAVRAAEKLRKQRSLAAGMSVQIMTSRFDNKRYSNSASVQFPYATNDSRLISSYAVELCGLLFRPGYRYAKAGIALLDLSDASFKQFDLFHKGQTQKSSELMKVMDAVNHRYGRGELFLARQGIDRKWSMVRQFKSPSYTTRFSDLPKIRI